MHDALPVALILLASAVAVVVLFRQLSMPAILGYLLVGAIVGPNALGLVADTEAQRSLGELGVVGAGMPQRTDSTHVLGRIRDLNRLELAGESVRAALEALAAAAPGWLAGVIDASWQQVYGQRIDALRLPASEAKRQDLAARYGRDGYRLLEAVFGPAAPGWLRREIEAAGALQVHVQLVGAVRHDEEQDSPAVGRVGHELLDARNDA